MPVMVTILLTEADANRYEASAYYQRAIREKQKLSDWLGQFKGGSSALSYDSQRSENALMISPEQLHELVEKASHLRAGYDRPLTMWQLLIDSLLSQGDVRLADAPGIVQGLRWYELQWNTSENSGVKKQEATIRLRSDAKLPAVEALRFVEALAEQWRHGQPPLSVSLSAPVLHQSNKKAFPAEFTLHLTWDGKYAGDVEAGVNDG